MPQTALSIGQLSVYKEIELSAPATQVWRVIGDFKKYDQWHSLIENTVLTAGKGNNPGDIRVITLANNLKVTERLLVYSEEQKTYTYTITASNSALTVVDYVATISVEETEIGTSKVAWHSTFNANPDVGADKAIEKVNMIYDTGFNNLANHFNK
jgi:uncharacterized protein YndB with AHSA1/START domain